jgi:AcrR family transcriptional regulator
VAGTVVEPFSAPVGREAAPAEARGPGRRRDPAISARVLAATLDVLAEEGYAGLGIEAVAQRAGVHKPAVYRRWSTKADLVVAAVRSIAPQPRDPATGDVRTDLVELVQEASRAQRDPRVRAGLRLLAEVATDDELAAEITDRVVGAGRAIARRVIERGIVAGRVREDVNVDLLVDIIFGTLQSRLLVTRRPLTRSQVEQVVDVVLDGVAVH